LLLREHLERAVGKLKTHSGFAVFCLDLDQFKQVNDTLGHPIGDELLKLVAMRLRDCIGDQDLVARLGGDEFAIVYDGVQLPERSGELAARIINAISEPYEIEGRQIVIGASIGVANAPGDSSDPDQLLKNADMALYLAKGNGRGIYRFFEPEMDRRLQERLTLQTDLRLAIVNGELELYYQPVVGTDTRQITGFEALVRWNHPQRGLVLPNEFISLAEETGLILPLGEWVLRNACSQAVSWPKHVSVAVNLSPAQFKSGNIIQMVVSALAASGLPPARLELEITESVLMLDTSDSRATLNRLRALGIHISMDDFGTGYSSLSYLQSFPFDKIKIDRSFIRDLALRDDCKAIVRAVTSMARSLKMKTVAEGVETAEQFELVAVEGCDQVQGYYFGHPMKIEKVIEALKDSFAFQAA
jgi:diguanylate cyclase (GGDEF)-like protein